MVAVLVAGCGAHAAKTLPAPRQASSVSAAPTVTSKSAVPAPRPARAETAAPVQTQPLLLLPGATATGLFRWIPAVAVRGQVAVAVERVAAPSEVGANVTLLRFSQSLVQLALHAGYLDPGGSGWSHGDAVGPAEVSRLVAAFNGGFKFSAGAGGYVADGRVAVPLRAGLASVVTYTDGSTNIGRWGSEVPEPGLTVSSVRQNLQPLIDQGTLAGTVDSCVRSCWGSTLGSQVAVARSGLGVDAQGQLIWAGGERLTVRALGEALLAAGAVRALELDINPEWVAGYLYQHPRPGTAAAVQQIPTQHGVPGQFLAPYGRDFFTITVR